MEDDYKLVRESQYLDIGILVTYQRVRDLATMKLLHRINVDGANGHWFSITETAKHGRYQFDAYSSVYDAKVVKVEPLDPVNETTGELPDPAPPPLVEVGGMGAFATVATEGPVPAVAATPIFDESDYLEDAAFSSVGYDKGTDEGSGLTIFVLTGDDGSGISIENASIEDLHKLLAGTIGD